MKILIFPITGVAGRTWSGIVSLVDVAEDIPVAVEVEADTHTLAAGERGVHRVREVSGEQHQVSLPRSQPEGLAEWRKRSSGVGELDIWIQK